jgi:hypothetical protein
MSKSTKLADELISIGILSPEGKEAAVTLIKQYFEMVHEEAVDATVMAENKKHFNKPKYQD